MKHTIGLIVLVLFIVIALTTLCLSIYIGDKFLLGIGSLLIIASLLIFLEVKSLMINPFRRG